MARAGAGDYDAACKQVLSERQVLSRVLRDWVPGFGGAEPALIERECFAGDPRTGLDRLERDDVPGAVAALAAEDATLSEGTATFDVRFEATEPAAGPGAGLVRVEVDVEAQNDFHPGYPLVRRGVFYGGRLLSMQGDDVIPGGHYERVRRVVSVWVCAHPPRGYAGTVTRMALEPTRLVGEASWRREDYDLIQLVMACLDDRDPGSSPGALGMLEVLLARGMGAREKLGYLRGVCGMDVAETLDERVVGMCNLGAGIMEEGLREGRKEGRREGRREGQREERDRTLGAVAALVRDGHLALSDAIEAFGLGESEIKRTLAV